MTARMNDRGWCLHTGINSFHTIPPPAPAERMQPSAPDSSVEFPPERFRLMIQVAISAKWEIHQRGNICMVSRVPRAIAMPALQPGCPTNHFNGPISNRKFAGM